MRGRENVKYFKLVVDNMGAKGVACGPEGVRLLTTVYQQNSENAIYSYQVPYLHVHVMAPGKHLRRLRHVGAQSESLKP